MTANTENLPLAAEPSAHQGPVMGVGSGALLGSVVLDWPDRAGYWWASDRFGFWLAESYACKDAEAESPFAVLLHHGATEQAGPFFPSDGEGKFAWLGASFPVPNSRDEPDGGDTAMKPQK